MLARMSKLIGPMRVGRLPLAAASRGSSSSSRSSTRASRSRIGRMVTSTRRAAWESSGHHSSSVPANVLQPRAEVGAEVVAIDGELHDRLEVVEPVAGVVAATAEHDAVHAARPCPVRWRAPAARRSAGSRRPCRAAVRLEHVEDLGPQHVAADDREVRRAPSPGAGFSTRPVMRTTSSSSVGSTVAMP